MIRFMHPIAIFTMAIIATAQPPEGYPKHWWTPVSETGKPEWKILPQAAKAGEVILSKRNELGILSNFAPTPFTFRGKRYASIEGFWQMMLYPENASDPRAKPGIVWAYTREQVAQMTSFQAKAAGNQAEANMRQLGIQWVTFEGRRMTYRSMTKGEHYRLIRDAMVAKLDQNPKVRETLLATGDLILRPDHMEEPNAPPEWRYYEIWMGIRADLKGRLPSSFEFSDEPKYAVAGVEQTTYMGVHGSDAGGRSAEALRKATTSLSQDAASRATSKDKEVVHDALVRDPNNADLHRLMGDLDEHSGKPLEALREYERAAELQSSEQNLFDWGTELLVHGAPGPASQVFDKGLRLYPHTPRLLLASAVALYIQGKYPNAGRQFFEAADRNPYDPQPYLFLGKVQAPEITGDPGYLTRMARFAQLDSDNAPANYLYAVALLRSTASSEHATQAKSLLEKAVRLDPRFAPAHLQLGLLHAESGEWNAAIESYQNAARADPLLEEAHYRLAAAYRHVGDNEKAKSEFETFSSLAKTSAQRIQQERSELQRFIVNLKSQAEDH